MPTDGCRASFLISTYPTRRQIRDRNRLNQKSAIHKSYSEASRHVAYHI
jgi:hypothetical protein